MKKNHSFVYLRWSIDKLKQVLSEKALNYFSLLSYSIAKRGLSPNKYFCKFIDMDLYWFSIIGFTTSYLFLIVLGLSLLTISITCIIAFFYFEHREISRWSTKYFDRVEASSICVLIMIAEEKFKIDRLMKNQLAIEEEQQYNTHPPRCVNRSY